LDIGAVVDGAETGVEGFISGVDVGLPQAIKSASTPAMLANRSNCLKGFIANFILTPTSG
jgi:hypothetical protein